METHFIFQDGDIIASSPLQPLEGNVIIKYSVVKELRDYLFTKAMEHPDQGYHEAHTLLCGIISKYCNSCEEQMKKGVQVKDEHSVRYGCINCGHELIWQSDFNYDEVHGEGEGVVSHWYCPHCGAMHEVSVRTDNEEEKD